MKIIHIADLHFGKSLHGYSLISQGDQNFWAECFLGMLEVEQPDAVVIAGDVYDRSAPANDAVELLSHFLTGIAKRNIPTLLVAGNHDSGEKLSFAKELLEDSKLYIAGVPERELRSVTLEDEYGPVTFWLMPYLFPAKVAAILEDEGIRDYDTAIRRYLAEQDIDFSQRNVLVAHQNVTANGAEAERGGSETMVGGVGEVDYTTFDGFDHVALGHIHAAQSMGCDTVRYAGSPMCYHFSETKRPKKGPLVVTLGEKGGDVQIETRILPTVHTMREIRGSFEEILQQEADGGPGSEYLRIVLNDLQIPADAGAVLTALFQARGSKVMEVARDLEDRKPGERSASHAALQEKSLEELFLDFYMERTGAVPDGALSDLAGFVAEQVRNSSIIGADNIPQAETDALLKYLMEQEG